MAGMLTAFMVIFEGALGGIRRLGRRERERRRREVRTSCRRGITGGKKCNRTRAARTTDKTRWQPHPSVIKNALPA
ncbi:hypothetical protein C8R45DRAFT_1215156 [Mycena sanguinolenta]|nr:hypothetical protein C8R45DRAFT_1215156 [Mycena sanguinolenta]